MTTTVTQAINELAETTGVLKLTGDHSQSASSPTPSKPLAAPAADYKYARYLPHYDQTLKLAPLEPFEHVDPGHAALEDKEPRSFLKGAKVNDLTPKFGSEVEGIQISQLGEREKSQLALYVAQRGVVVFREQDFADQAPEWQLNEWGSTFGRLHTHPTSASPKDYPEFHLVYKDAAPGGGFPRYDAQSLSSTGWHSDVSYEEQPPGLTTLFLYNNPTSGGDTGYVSQVEAYNKLSPSLRGYLETLSVVHSGVAQAEFSRRGNRGGVVKREPVENVHPLVRTHPLTGEKALYVNKQFSRRIVGLKTEESDAILNLLYTHIAQGADFQIRAQWKPRSVVLWDNRVTAHTAIGDFDPAEVGFRHGSRITPQAERPFLRQ